MEFVNRARLDGFQKYFSNRPEHFKEIYGMEYSDESAEIFHQQALWLKRKWKYAETSKDIIGEIE